MNQPEGSEPRRRGRWTRRLLLGALAAVAIGAAAIQGRALLKMKKVEAATPAAAKAKEAPSVAVAAVETAPISAYTSATANLVAEDEVKVVAETEGKVIALLVDEGHTVSRGQALVRIDPADASLALGKAELAARNAELAFQRAERMASERLISPQDLDKARYDRDVAAHAVAEARHRLGKTSVTAPFAGRITVRRVQLGQNVRNGDELFTLADFEPLVARIFLPEREVLDLKRGQDVRLSLRAREETRFAGRIQQISPVVDTASGTVKVTVEAVAPPPSVRPGAFVTVEVLRETRPRALLVPRPAVIRELQETYVFVAEAATARKRPIEVGLEEGDRIEVTRGVAAGEKVITAGQGSLKDGSAIAVAPAAKS